LKRVVVFASGSGSNFKALLDASASGKLSCEFAGLISNVPGIGAISRAEKHGIPICVIRRDDFTGRDFFVSALLAQLANWKTDVIVLAGYLKKLPDEVVAAYRGRIINIHPSLLPKFGGKGFHGLHVHKAVLEAGEQETGCTVHQVDEIFDNGAILAQRTVPVLSDDTPESLQQRVLVQEHQLLPETLQLLIQRLT
jgi:formyltetrahydrofolate-dependent phosphoribosylglycinamide formyltransferase